MIQKYTDIHPNARIDAGANIQNFVTIEENVVIGKNCWIGSGAVIMNGARLGDDVKIFPGAIIAGIPQDLKFDGEESLVEIGDNTTVREYVTINRGTAAAGITQIGQNCLIQAYCHIAHDCIIGDHCIMSNNATLAGHVTLEDYAILGGMSAVHQFSRVGAHTMIGGYSKVRTDVPPYVKADRDPLAYEGVNSIGLKRRGFSQERIHHIQDIYRILFVFGKNFNKSIEQIKETIPESEDKTLILDFLNQSTRGIIKGI